VTTVTRPKIGRYAAGDFPQAQQFLRAVFVNPATLRSAFPATWRVSGSPDDLADPLDRLHRQQCGRDVRPRTGPQSQPV